MDRLKNKKVVITGATSGIGEAAAHEFAKAGAHLMLTGRREHRLQALCKELETQYSIQALPYAFDIREKEACHSFVESVREVQVDILVNNAGLALGTDPVFELSEEDADVMIDTNVRALLRLTRLFSPEMKARNQGHIINISSTAAHEAYAGGVVYCATKHAVRAITEATKKDLHGTNVRISMISPGLVETEFSKVRFKGDNDKADSVYQGLQPLTARDVAEIIVFVASRPGHVNIMDTIIYPVYQSSPTMVYRDE